MDRTQPNILFITTDQQRWDSLSFYGTPGYRTPNLDRLARQGVNFARAYCPTPVCTPARVSMITGQYPTRHGAYQIGMEVVPALEGPTMGGLLRDAGYSTAIIGKTHFVARFLEEQHVAGERNPRIEKPDPTPDFWHEFDGPYLGFDFVRHCQSHTSDRLPNAHYRAWLEDKGLNLDNLHSEKAYRSTKTLREVNRYGRWEIDPELTQTAWITEQSIDWIREQHAAGRPWMCWASHQDPHPPYVCPEPYYSAVDMAGVDLGGRREGEWNDKPPLYHRFAESGEWGDSSAEEFLDPDCPSKNIPAHSDYSWVEKPAEAIRAYIGMCNMIDEHVGRLVATLDELGVRENTLIVFTTDHGDNLGRHGLWQKGIGAYDDCQRLPAIASWPAAQAGPVGTTQSAFNLVDVLPTFLDAAGAAIPPFVQGVSQLPVIRGETGMLREWALVDFLATPSLHQQTFVCDGYKLVIYRHAPYGELYDLSEDPEQYTNLFDSPDHIELKMSLMQRLVQANMHLAGKQPQRISNA